MNDETHDEADAPPGPGGWTRLIYDVVLDLPSMGGVLMAVIIVIALARYFIYGPSEPEGPHCAEAKGNATCVEYFGGNQPYCESESVTTINKGCSSERPPDEWAAPCGKLVGGLPGDPTCSKVVADNPPTAEVVAKRERVRLLERWIIPAIALGFFLVVSIWIYSRAFASARARASLVRRAQKLPASEEPTPTADDVNSTEPSP